MFYIFLLFALCASLCTNATCCDADQAQCFGNSTNPNLQPNGFCDFGNLTRGFDEGIYLYQCQHSLDTTQIEQYNPETYCQYFENSGYYGIVWDFEELTCENYTECEIQHGTIGTDGYTFCFCTWLWTSNTTIFQFSQAKCNTQANPAISGFTVQSKYYFYEQNSIN